MQEVFVFSFLSAACYRRKKDCGNSSAPNLTKQLLPAFVCLSYSWVSAKEPLWVEDIQQFEGWQCGFVSRFTSKYLNKYLTDCHEVTHKDSRCPEDGSLWLWWYAEFSSSATWGWHLWFFSEFSKQLLDRTPWNVMQTFMFFSCHALSSHKLNLSKTLTCDQIPTKLITFPSTSNLINMLTC